LHDVGLCDYPVPQFVSGNAQINVI